MGYDVVIIQNTKKVIEELMEVRKLLDKCPNRSYSWCNHVAIAMMKLGFKDSDVYGYMFEEVFIQHLVDHSK